MRILAIETATIEVGVAVADETGPLASVTARPGRRQAETLHPAIADVCRIAMITPAELDAIAVDIGPGLFTGLRVGVAAAKALAGALGLPVVTATSLEVLKAACPSGLGAVIPVIDMRRGEVAWLMPARPAPDVRVGARPSSRPSWPSWPSWPGWPGWPRAWDRSSSLATARFAIANCSSAPWCPRRSSAEPPWPLLR